MKKNSKKDVVIDEHELEEIAKIIKERVTNRKTPVKLISHEEMRKRVEKKIKEFKINS